MLKSFVLEKGVIESNGLPSTNSPQWVDVSNITKDEADQLQQQFNLHPLTTEDLCLARSRIKIEQFPNYLFCVFYFVHTGRTLRTVEIDFILGRNFIITNHLGKIDTIDELSKSKEKLEKLFRKGIEFLFHSILGREITAFIPTLDGIDREIDIIDKMVSKKANSAVLQKIMSVKKKIIYVKRIAMIQREKISALAKGEYELISKKLLPYLRDVYDNSIRIFEMAENYRETISSSYEVYMSTVSTNLNEIMKILSIITTISLPLTVISGIYGTNFQLLPGSSASYGFWIMIAVMVGITGSMILFFRRKKWL